MATIYQICVKGSELILNGTFKAFSKKVYTKYPPESEIQEFVEKCKKEVAFSALDPKAPYDVVVIELELV